MSLFEKLLIPLLDPNLTKEDVSPEAGFFGCYTEDIDAPYYQGVFLVYDNRKRGPQVRKTYDKLYRSKYVAHRYSKRINNIPYRIYHFAAINEGLTRLLQGLRPDTYDSIDRIIEFWMCKDHYVNDWIHTGHTIGNMPIVLPAADYNVIDKKMGVQVVKKTT